MSPQPGDWVVTTRVVKTSWTDHLLGDDAGIKRGTRGVVLSTSHWSSLEVRLDTGFGGPVTARLSTRDVRVVRRGGGTEAFTRRTGRVNAARAGVAVVLLAPLLLFVLRALLAGEGRDGIVLGLLDGALAGALDLVAYAIANPVAAGLWLLVAWLAGRFAFR